MKVLVLGQAPPKKIDEIPFSKTRLYTWLETVGITKDEASHFCFDAVVKNFPGKTKNGRDKMPNIDQVLANYKEIASDLKSIEPDIIITVGILAAQVILQNSKLKLNDIVGNKYMVNPFDSLSKDTILIPLPHPSGASPWVYENNNHKLLSRALDIFKTEYLKK